MANRLSFFSFWCCAALIVATAFVYYPKWRQSGTEATISWDVSGYYLYLPAAFIHGDLKGLAFFPAIEEQYHPGPSMGQAFKHPESGNFVMKYSMGQAIQMLPWFGLAHLIAPVLGYPADGFSLPYQAAISWGSLLVALLGLWVSRRNLLAFFSDKATAAALLLLTFGSNYLNYTAIDGAMTHNWLFTLYALILYFTILFYQKPTVLRAVAIGVFCGWAALTRPTEVMTVLIPLLWNFDKSRWAFFKKNIQLLLAAAASFVAVAMWQPIYWKWATGEWLVYSYQDQGFNWLRPFVLEVLFSFKAGWLPYSPVMIFAVLGLWHLWRSDRRLGLPVTLILGVILYVTSAWAIWWYGGSLGARAMVQGCALWLFPLAAFVEVAMARRWSSIAFPVLCGFLIWHNLWWTHQAHKGGLYVTEQMTQAYFLKVYGKSEKIRDWDKLLDSRDEFRVGPPATQRTIWQYDFENDTAAIMTDNGNKHVILDQKHQFSPKFSIPLAHENGQEWLRLHFKASAGSKEWEYWRMAQAIIRLKKGDTTVRERMIRLQRLLDEGETRDLSMDLKISDKSADRVEIYFWNADGDKTVWIDDLRLDQLKALR